MITYTTAVMADSGWCQPYGNWQSFSASEYHCTNIQLPSDESEGGIIVTAPCHTCCIILQQNGIVGSWADGIVNIVNGGSSPNNGWGNQWGCGFPTPNANKALGKFPPQNSIGDPINVGNGNVYRFDEDFSAGRWLTFGRYYNSASTAGLDTMGQHWRHSYASHLTYTAATSSSAASVTITREDDRVSTYQLVGSQWSGEADVPDALTEQTDSSGNPLGWTLLRVDTRSTEQFNVSGQLTSITDANGFVTTLIYSTSSTPSNVAPGPGYLISVVDPQQRAIQLTYNGSGLINQVTAPDGSTYSYAYDSNHELQTVTYPGGKSWTYLYGESPNNGGNTSVGLLTGVIDEAGGRLFSYSYNAAGQGINSQMAGGVASYAITYNSDGSVDVADPLGTSRHRPFTTLLGVPYLTGVNGTCEACSNVSTWSYDFNGYVNQTTDFNGNVTIYTHDGDGMETGRVEGYGSATMRPVQTDWNDTFHVPTEQRRYSASYALVEKTDWLYNANGQPIARCEIDATNSAASGYTCSNTGTVPAGVRRWTYTYCTAVGAGCPLVGLMLTETGPRTDLTQTTYYSYYTSSSTTNCGTPGAACYQAGDLHTVTDAQGHVTTVASYDAEGRITRITDANGINTDMTYTARGWLASRSVGGATTSFTYTPYGAVQTVTDPDGVFTTYGYDTAHRLVRITDAQGNYIQYTLDTAGDKTGEQVYDSSGALHKSLARTFNTLGQLTTLVDGLNNTVFNASASNSYDANGNLVQSTDGLGIQRQQGYDAVNRLVQTIDNYNGGDATTKNTTTQYSYDSLDRLTQVTDPSSLNTTYSYNGLSDAIRQVSPDTGTTSRTFDAAGNVLTRIDAKGITATNTYDALNRLISTSYPDTTQNVTYSYDDPNSATGCGTSYPIGRLTRIIENSVTTVYCYDTRGNVIQKQQITGAGTDITDYSVSAAGRLSGIVYPSGTLVTYTRDGDGRIQSISVTPPSGTASTVVSGVSYQPFGPINGYTLGNGQQIARAYDANYRLTDLTSPAFNLHLARDVMGDITAIGNAPGANPATETYSYDPLYRLIAVTEASGTILESVTYNQTGDRLTKTGNGLASGTYSYNTNTHQLIATGNATRTIDADGNTTGISEAGGAYVFGYSNRNRMTVAQLAGSTIASYTYNALNQRIQKVASSATERYDYNEGSQILGEYGAKSRDYIWMDGIPVANVDTSGTTSTIAYVTADQLGTPRAIADVNGNTQWQWSYQGNPWGEQAPTSSGYVYNLGFPGQYFDVETGLFHNGFRDYDSGSGRYIESDHIGLNGGINTYIYGLNNPLMYDDPLGLRPPTPSEIAFLKAFFGKCFNAQRMDINKRLFGSRAWSPFDHHVNLPGNDFIGGNGSNSVNTSDPYIASILAHETLHTWQRDQGANVTTSEIGPQIAASLGGSDPYSYDQSINDPAANLAQFQAMFNNSNYEAQAQMWQDYVYSKLTGGDVSKWSEIANYVQSKASCGCKQ
ncbi:type IV secretion protein Rhs [Dyella nitratireducens]|uniref:Type IV secretion protein Rhs n=3 Tax=Dyella nitratireducens TaxID=1849580 RepID=A0ABQ1FZ80_9GAMM|nr:type IV secretion protein Rhs [Dyella nitratireducens]GLQ40734.1 type IV secretion protein Rhs [Dyella nitratireducens]